MNQLASPCLAKLNCVSLLAGLTLLLTTLSAHATLGGDSASVLADQKALGATLKITTNNDYTDYALSFPNGGVAHEFVNRSGQVFEVTWSKYGSRPYMLQLLGNYAQRFSGTSNQTAPTSRHADRMDNDFELHSKVMNRHFSGTAHIPAMLPAGRSGPLDVPAETGK